MHVAKGEMLNEGSQLAGQKMTKIAGYHCVSASELCKS